MKTAIAVTLIIIGGILLAAPLALDHIRNAQILAAAAAGHTLSGVNVETGVNAFSRIVCWIAGAAMVLTAIRLQARTMISQPSTHPASIEGHAASHANS
jgi:hypothetical protein